VTIIYALLDKELKSMDEAIGTFKAAFAPLKGDATSTFAVLTGAGISHAAGIPMLRQILDMNKHDLLPPPLEQTKPQAAHYMIGELVQQACIDRRKPPVLLSTNHDGLEGAVATLANTICLHGQLSHRRCPRCDTIWPAATPDSEHRCVSISENRKRKIRGVFVGESAMRVGGKGVKCKEWLEYKQAISALKSDQSVKLIVVVGVDGSVASGALFELIKIVCFDNKGQ
jgi:NAD-dependent SIR2 family protein deacetylase